MNENMAAIDLESVYPKMSLTKWGGEVLHEIDEKFKHGQSMEFEQKFHSAIELYNECFIIAENRKAGLSVDQYLTLITHLAYCYTNTGESAKATKYFNIKERILKEENDWISTIPENVTIIPGPLSNKTEQLARHYQDMAVILYRLKKIPESRENFFNSTNLFIEIGMPDSALKSLIYLGQLAQHYRGWNDMRDAGAKILELGLASTTENRELALRFIFQADAFSGALQKARETLLELIALGEETNSDYLQEDIDTLKQLDEKIKETNE